MNKSFRIKDVFLKKSNFCFSDENYLIENKMKGLNNINIQLELKEINFSNIDENNFLSELGIKIIGVDNESKTEVFVAETNYACIAEIIGFTKDEVFRIHHINIAPFIFPYVRSEINRILADTSLPRFSIQPIDFANMYYSKYEKKED